MSLSISDPEEKAKLSRPIVPLSQRWQNWRFRHRQALEAWLILTPILIYFCLFNILPVVLNIFISFTQWNGISGVPQWVGLDNYLQYLQDPYPLILFNTVFFAFIILIVQTSLAFFVAVLLNQKLLGRGVYRSLWYVPSLTSAAVMAQVATVFIAPYGGVLNTILKSLGQSPIIWTIDATWMRIFIVLFSVWRGIGGPVILFLAALQGINRELYEAAMVDGATRWKITCHITLPLLRPMILFVVVTTIIGGFQIFEAVFLISKGGPASQTNVLLVQIYNDAFANNNFGVASAGATLMLLILVGFSIASLRLGRQE